MERSETGYLHEVFTSIQGEGLWAGYLQHFVRFAGCSAGCRYCDTEKAWEPEPRFSIHGSSEGENPIEAFALVKIVDALDDRMPGAQALAVTGGEPLEQAGFLADLLLGVKERCRKPWSVLLETAGFHPEAIERVKARVDLVSMDIKLPSTSELKDCMDRHRRFLDALGNTRFYVKVAVSKKTSHREVIDAAALVATKNPKTPFFVQPVTGVSGPEGGAYLLKLWRAARDVLEDVRIVPQFHRFMGLA
jgi:organic radical activating enzyme